MRETNKDLIRLLQTLPIFFRTHINFHPSKGELLEIILDLGKKPEVRFISRPEYISQKIVSWQDLDYIKKRISEFNNDNRAGIDRTLHRISCIRNRHFLINGLTYRIGRSIFGTIAIINDLLYLQNSILILGKPGVGKTTIIREIARVLADEMEQRVIIIDTSNEIGGDSDIPHLGIGRARRMQVYKTELQHRVMVEAVENHMPQIIIIDEISTELEVLTAQAIAEKGVQLIGTTHGSCLQNLVKNPILTNLIGGVQNVTLSDEESKRRGTQKSIIERKSYSTFNIIVELQSHNLWVIHENSEFVVDSFLTSYFTFIQTREPSCSNSFKIKCERFLQETAGLQISSLHSKLESRRKSKNFWLAFNQIVLQPNSRQQRNKVIIYPYSISTNLIKEVLTKLNFNYLFTNNLQESTLIIGSKKYLTQNLKLKKVASAQNIPIYELKSVNFYQIVKLLDLIITTCS